MKSLPRLTPASRSRDEAGFFSHQVVQGRGLVQLFDERNRNDISRLPVLRVIVPGEEWPVAFDVAVMRDGHHEAYGGTSADWINAKSVLI